MRFSTAATLLAATASVFASTLVRRQGYPACTIPCMQKVALGDCISTDIKCLCESQVFVSNTTQCFRNSCNGTDLTNALDLGRQNCLKVGVALSATPASTPSGSPTGLGGAYTTSSGASKTSRDIILCLGAAALVAFCL